MGQDKETVPLTLVYAVIWLSVGTCTNSYLVCLSIGLLPNSNVVIRNKLGYESLLTVLAESSNILL